MQFILCQLHDVVLLDCPQISIFLLEAHVALLALEVFYLTFLKGNKYSSKACCNWFEPLFKHSLKVACISITNSQIYDLIFEML